MRAPRPWLAAVLALLCGGLGHLYAGRPALAASILVLWLALPLGVAGALRVGAGATLASLVAAVAAWLGQAAHAWVVARNPSAGPRPRSSRPLALAAFYSLTLVVSVLVVPRIRAAIAHTVYMPSGSMLPTIQVGDYLTVAAPRHPLQRGAVVELEAPPGAPNRDNLLKRIVAVGGDSVELRDGALWVNDAAVARAPASGDCRYATRTYPDGAWREEPCLDFLETLGERAYHTLCTPAVPCGDVARVVVPAGHVWVAGDHRDHSADSRVFGPVPENQIVGEVELVLLSWGPLGPRWERTGARIR